MRFLLSVVFALIICLSAKSQSVPKNNFLFTEALKQLKLKEEDVRTELYTEKVLPYLKSQSVLVIPKIISSDGDAYNNYSFDFDAYIVIVDNKSGKIINKYFESDAWISDAVMLSSIEIDTAPYLLQPNNRAFGIIVNYTGSSRPNPYGRSDLTLFAIDGNALKPLLKNYVLAESTGEWDTNCRGEFEDMHSILLIDKQKSNNWSNIIVKQTITSTKNFVINDDCESKEVVRHKKLVLKYHEGEYK